MFQLTSTEVKELKHILNTIHVFVVPAVKSASCEDVSHIAGPAGENIPALNSHSVCPITVYRGGVPSSLSAHRDNLCAERREELTYLSVSLQQHL